MNNDEAPSYTVRNYDAVNEQIAEIAARERVHTEALKQANLRKLAVSAVIFAGAAAIVIIAIGLAIWLAKKETVTVKTVEVPVKIVEVPVYGSLTPPSPDTVRAIGSTGISSTLQSNSEGISRLEGRVKPAENKDETAISTSETSEDNQNTTTLGINEIPASKQNLLSRKRADLGKTYNSGARIILTWNGYHDLDLFVREPSGNEIYYTKKLSPSGGYLDLDENVRQNDSTSTPIETIGWEQNQLVGGNYEISVGLFRIDSRTPGRSIPYTITIVDDGEVSEITKTISVEKVKQKVTSVQLL